ncbi:hypothetical protein GCM10008934_33280 [Virgibacillus salarius]
MEAVTNHYVWESGSIYIYSRRMLQRETLVQNILKALSLSEAYLRLIIILIVLSIGEYRRSK